METNIIIQDNTNDIAAFSIIRSRIHEIRGQKVMLDFDLAEIYEVETKRLKEQVRRNIERFPEDFMFQLSKEEWSELVANCDHIPKTLKHSYIIPLAFTQEGVAMLSGVLRSQKAIESNISIMRAFVLLRQYALNYAEFKQELENINAKLNKNDTRFKEVFKILDELMRKKQETEKPRTPIGYKLNKNTKQ
jgi:hypothetical protein